MILSMMFKKARMRASKDKLYDLLWDLCVLEMLVGRPLILAQFTLFAGI